MDLGYTLTVQNSNMWKSQKHFKHILIQSYIKRNIDHSTLFYYKTKVGEFLVLTAASMKMTVLWDVVPCSLV
jgi:hypothetical protein